MLRPWVGTALAGALLLTGCGAGGNGPVIGEGADDGPQRAVAPECDELEGEPYSPPAEEQPPADPTLTDAQPHDDVPIESGEDADGVDAEDSGEESRDAQPAPADPMSQVHDWAEREAPEHFAGMWYDNDEGATVVAFTDDVERYAAEVRERFGEGWWVVELEHSWADLQEVQERLGRQEMDWSGDGRPRAGDVYGAGLRSPINRVTVRVLEPDEQRLAELSERYGADVICFEIESLPGEQDAQPAPWEPAPGADLSPESTSIDILVNEVGCASGEPADGRIPDPDVVYGDEEVVVTVGVVPKPGAQTCPGNPDTEYTLHLEEPLGQRTLLDGRQQPPAEPDLEHDPIGEDEESLSDG